MKATAFGEPLRRSREAQGIALKDIAQRTRIAVHHLEALEASDLDALPAGPFARAYVRTYAEALGIDPEPVLEACRVEERRRGLDTPEGERRMLQELSQLVGRGTGARPARLRSKPVWLAVAAVSVAFLATVGWHLAHRGSGEGEAAPPARPVRAPARPVAAPARPVATPARPARAPTRPTPAPRSQVVRPSPAPPAAVPAEATARTPSPPTGSLEVSGFGIGTDVVARQLVGRGDRFPEGSRVVFWTEILGGRSGHVVHHVWFQGGRAVMRARLPVQGPHWRTHSSIVLPTGGAGGWTVEARTSDGRLLARNDFVCEPRRAQ